MKHSIPDSTHLSRQKLNMFRELTDRLDTVNKLSKEDMHMHKLKKGKTAECFRHIGEIKNKETEALTQLEKYLKADAKKNPTHNHKKDLYHIEEVLKKSKKYKDWI